MEGLNSTVTFYRALQLDDDTAGGSQRDAYKSYVSARARVAQQPATLEMRAQGLGTDLLYDVVVQPATVAVQSNDMMIPDDGPFAHVRFRVTGVQYPHMLRPYARAHLRLQLERWDDGKVMELL